MDVRRRRSEPQPVRVLKGPIMDPKREPIPKPAKVMEED